MLMSNLIMDDKEHDGPEFVNKLFEAEGQLLTYFVVPAGELQSNNYYHKFIKTASIACTHNIGIGAMAQYSFGESPLIALAKFDLVTRPITKRELTYSRVDFSRPLDYDQYRERIAMARFTVKVERSELPGDISELLADVEFFAKPASIHRGYRLFFVNDGEVHRIKLDNDGKHYHPDQLQKFGVLDKEMQFTFSCDNKKYDFSALRYKK